MQTFSVSPAGSNLSANYSTASRPRVLVVDDEHAVCWSLEHALVDEGFAVQIASSAEEAFIACAKRKPDVIVLDIRLPGMDGLTALEKLRSDSGGAPVVMITAYGDLDTAVKAIERGVFEYLTKPFDLSDAIDTVRRAAGLKNLPVEKVTEAPATNEDGIIGNSPAMQNIFKRIALVAGRDSCVLITGESGTGKEMAARAIHRHSGRRNGPFLPIHIAALNPSIIESELFGHVKGSFTGAMESRPGLMELAEGGTVFLDELGDIPLGVQAKLLRVLERHEIVPVGGSEAKQLNVRVLAATHQDLAPKVAEGTFRHDLFFRLNVFGIHLPALRDRADDLSLLVNHFYRQFEANGPEIPAATFQFLRGRSWPGNVRELRNALEHAVILSRGAPLLPEHFPQPLRVGGSLNSSDSLSEAVRHWIIERLADGEKLSDLHEELLSLVEPPLLEEVLRHDSGNRLLASSHLGLNRATVRKKLARYKLSDLGKSSNETVGD